MARGDVLPRRNLPQSAEPWGRKIGERVQDIEGALNRAEAAIVANNRAQNGLGVVLAGTSNLAEDLKANSELVAETINQVNIDLTKNAEILEAANLKLDANKEALIQLDKDLVKEAQERVDAILAVQGAIADLSGEIEAGDGGPTVSPNSPTAENGEGKKNGALWYRVDGQKNVVGTWRWTGTEWDPVTFGPGSISAGIMDDIATAKTDAQSALTGAGNANLAAQTADGKVTWSLSAPVAANGQLADGRNRAEGSTWYHRDAANNVIGLYRWNGTTAWVSQPLNAGAIANNAITSDKLATAVTTSITTAQQTADGKNTVHYLGTAPAGTGHKVGDTWFDTGNGNRIMRWSGSAWVSALIGNGAISDLAISNAKLADNAVNAAKILNGSVTSDQLSNAVNTSITTAQQTATNAQTSATEAKNYSSAVLAAAENQIVDGSFSLGQWAGVSAVWVVDNTVGRNDSSSLRKLPLSGTVNFPLTRDATGAARTVPVEPGQTWEISGWFRTSADWNGTAGNSKLRISRQDGRVVGPANSAYAITTGWAQVGGRWTIPTGVTALGLSIMGDNSVGTILWDDIIMRDVSAVVAAETIAGAAQTAADAAKTAADAAKAVADNAQTTANGKNKNTRSTAVASGAGVNGDQWWQYQGTQVIGMWIHNGSTWVAQTLTDSVITNLNAGTITSGYIKAALIEANTITGTHIAGTTITAANMVAGTITAASGIIANAAIGNAQIANLAVTNAKIADATIQSAKIGSVDAETITVNKLKGVQIEAGTIKGENIAAGTIGTGKLMIGDFEDLFEDRSLATTDAWTGSFSLIPRSSPNQAANMMVIRGGGATTAVDVHSTKIVDVLGGEKIAVEGQVFTGAGASGTAWIFARVTLANGTYQWPNVAKSITSAQGTDVISGIITVPANAVKLQMAVSLRGDFTPDAVTNWHSLSAKFQKPSTLIEDGAITTDKMVANSIEGDRIKAGTLNADKIVSGSIAAAQIKAGSIFSDRLAVGNFDNLIEDPLFQLPLTAGGPWTTPSGTLAAWSYISNSSDPVRAIRGTATPGTVQRLANRNRVSVTTGERFVLSTRAASSIAGTNAQVGVVWRTLNGGFHSANYYSIPGGGGFQNHAFTTNPAPAAAVYAEFELQIPAAATGGSVQFGNLLWQTSIGRTVIQGGAIGTDQIESKAIITDKLAASAVTADTIAANAITADKIKANEISSDKIATAGLNAGVIKFGAMSGARIQANTISASKLVIGDFTNLVDDPYFTLSLGATDSEWVRRSGATSASTLSTTDGLPGSTMTLRGVSSEVSVWTKGTFQVQPGQRYRVDFRVQNHLTGSSPISYVRVYWFQKNMAAATGGFSGISIPAGTSWTDALGATVTAPANAALARVMLIHESNNTGGTWWIGNIAVRRTTGATLIDDKSISTNSIVTEGLNANTIAFGTMHGDRIQSNTIATKHIVTTGLTADAIAANSINTDKIVTTGLTAAAIATGAITAGKIAGDAVTADTIKADAIDGMTITGATLRTAASGTRVQIDGTGTQNGMTVYTGNTAQVRLGYGIDTGLEVRNPNSGAMVPLADHAFGVGAETNTTTMNFPMDGTTWSFNSFSSGTFQTRTGRVLLTLTFEVYVAGFPLSNNGMWRFWLNTGVALVGGGNSVAGIDNWISGIHNLGRPGRGIPYTISGVVTGLTPSVTYTPTFRINGGWEGQSIPDSYNCNVFKRTVSALPV